MQQEKKVTAKWRKGPAKSRVCFSKFGCCVLVSAQQQQQQQQQQRVGARRGAACPAVDCKAWSLSAKITPVATTILLSILVK